ncbi:NAD(P)H-binding protein [Lacisediminihabitans profunda]|uniref:NAD(P)H-binding protein n=1 Tax=Lacisediminihabitans profunda TaxID=2594790 RepID=A0A5C8UJB1_9MICO|nr:NAD(P)H-binding protein [Lacisediminihabitans profunda]TXN28321.1 NAD(P)H-binding protein [Lacisediminihabitans profunda]
MNSYLIIGGTGKVGGRLAQILRTAGNTVRIASRTGGDVRFDWRDTATYRPALAGIDGIFVVGPGSATDWSGLLTELLQAAEAEGVQRAVFLSARGVEFLPGGAVALAEEALRAGPLDWTILRPTHFAQNFTEAMFVPVDGEVHAPVADGAEPFIDIEDLAEVAAAVLVDPGYARDTIDISGPSAVGFDQAVSVLGRHAGRSFTFVDEHPTRHEERLREANTPEGYIAWRMAMLGGIRRGEDAYLSDGVERVLGRPATSFSDWARREAASLTESL